MDSRKIFDAIDACDDVFIKEVIQDIESRRKSRRGCDDCSLIRISICQAFVLRRQLFFYCSSGSWSKDNSTYFYAFHDWMENIFTKNDVIQIIPDSTTVDMGNAKISLKNHVQMTGQNETFLYETSYDGIEEKVEKVIFD